MPIVKITADSLKISQDVLSLIVSRLRTGISAATNLPLKEISIHVSEFHSCSQKDEELYIEIITISKRKEQFTEELLKTIAKSTKVKTFVWVFFNDAPHS